MNDHATPSRASWPLRLGASLVLAVALAAVVGSAVLRVFDFGHPGDYGEGPVLGMVRRVAVEPISARWLDGPPYTLSCYGPGYYWAVASAAAVLPWPDTLIPGRLVSLLATLATAALVGMAVGRSTWASEGTVPIFVSTKMGLSPLPQAGELGLATALAFLASPIVHAWGTPHRVDPLATLFAVGAYLAVARPRHGIVASAACVVIGSLVKQTVALAAVPIFCYLLLSRRYRDAAKYALAVAVPGAAVWLALDWQSGGYFLASAVHGNLGAMFPGQGFWAGHAFLATPLGTVAGLLVAWRFVRRPAAMVSGDGSLWCLGFVLNTLFASILSAKEGAAANYFLEASALGALVIGRFGLGTLWSRAEGRTLAVVALVALILAAPDVRFIRERGLRLDRRPFGSAVVAGRLRSGGGALADGQLVPAVLHAGQTPLVNDPFVFRLMVEQGRIDAAPLVDAIERGDVRWLVLKQTLAAHREHVGRVDQKWPAAVLDAMEEHYVLAASGDEVYLYRRRDARNQQSP
jgi:hypothetical protein